MNLTAILDELVPAPQPFRSAALRLFGFSEVERIYHSLRESTQSIPEHLLDQLAVTYRMGDADLQHVPKTGPAFVVANHPFGVLEGAVLATVLKRVRPDVRFLANELLGVIPEIQDLLIPVDVTAGQPGAQRNWAGLRRAVEFVKQGGCLVVFPAGEVSRFHPRERAVTDSVWNTAVARIIETLARHGVAVPTVPVYIHGSNSLLFQALGMLHPKLRTMLLARELLNKRERRVDLRIGSAITSKKLLEIPTATQRTDYLRWRTYLLANRPAFKALTGRPLASRVRRTQKPVAAAVDAGILSAEVAALGAEHLLAGAGDLNVYIAPAHRIPALLREIGRLREVTFRATGEGTGKTLDLDRFDDHYLHLFAWNPAKREIVGAYRMAGTDQSRDLYTATLFRYGDVFLERMGPALELGRSFVREEYQRGFAPLLALWKGIGKHVARNPRYRMLFGPVSISNQYQAVSRELMVMFLERNASLRDWMNLVSNRNPLKFRARKPEIPAAGFGLEDLSDVISDLEPSRAGIPVLLRQYLKLGGKLLAFNVDPEFSDALDGLIVVDLLQTKPKLLDRYLGKAEASALLNHQKGTHGT